MKTLNGEVKRVKGPKGAVATFVRPRDNKRIYVFCKDSEAIEVAIKRVMKHNGASGGEYAKCN